MTYYTRDLKHLDDDRPHAVLMLITIAIVLATAILVTIKLREYSKTVKARQNCAGCHTQQRADQNKLAAYFRKGGSPEPEALAYACIQTRSPRLMAAIAKVETRGKDVRGTGYKRMHDGPWQVNRRIWGPVSHDLTEAALQAEFALKSHVHAADGSIVKGLNAYGGDTTRKKYAYNVLRELEGVPR